MGCGHEKACVGYGRHAAHSCSGDSRKAEELSRLCIPKLSHPPPAVNTSRGGSAGTQNARNTHHPRPRAHGYVIPHETASTELAELIARPVTTPHCPCAPAGRPRGGPAEWAAAHAQPAADAGRQRGERGGKVARKEPRRDGSQRRDTHLWAAAIAPPSTQASDGSPPAARAFLLGVLPSPAATTVGQRRAPWRVTQRGVSPRRRPPATYTACWLPRPAWPPSRRPRRARWLSILCADEACSVALLRRGSAMFRALPLPPTNVSAAYVYGDIDVSQPPHLQQTVPQKACARHGARVLRLLWRHSHASAVAAHRSAESCTAGSPDVRRTPW